MKTAMQELLAQMKDERANLPMKIEWDRCYQAIEMMIQHTYLQKEKEQIAYAQSYAISNADMTNNKGYFDCEQYYKETFKQD